MAPVEEEAPRPREERGEFGDHEMAFEGEADFAQNIRNLANPALGNARVITDDVFYFAEPMFQDGTIAQAIDDVVTNRGVTYFSLAGNLAALDARFDSLVDAGGVSYVGKTPPNVPERVANLFATYRPEGSSFEYFASLNRTGPMYTDNANEIRINGVTTLDAAVSYRLRNALLSFRVRNLTDELYATWVGRSSSQVMLAPGRTFELSARFAF